MEQAPAYSYVAGEPRSYQNTVAIAPPAIPAAGPPVIPPPPRNYGPAPIDTVTQVHSNIGRLIGPNSNHRFFYRYRPIFDHRIGPIMVFLSLSFYYRPR